MATALSILISDTGGCVIFRRLSIAPVSGQPWEDFRLNHLVLAFLVAARFADPIVSLQPYQFARDKFTVAMVLVRVAMGIAGNLMSETALDHIRTERTKGSRQLQPAGCLLIFELSRHCNAKRGKTQQNANET